MCVKLADSSGAIDMARKRLFQALGDLLEERLYKTETGIGATRNTLKGA